jgi:hypothetical protein
MFGMPATAVPARAAVSPPAVVPAPVVAAGPPPAPMPSGKQTMLGIARPAAGATPAPQPAPGPAQYPSGKGTMLGVAIPGIAPVQASASEQASRRRGASSTMLGVAIPGIAPVRASGQPSVQASPQRARPAPVVLPKPAPLVDDEPALGPAPRLVRRGIPLAYVASGVFALVLVFGGVVAMMWKGQSLVVVPKLDAQGHEQLHLECDSCQDGTTAALDGAKATFSAKHADLVLTTPLKVGDNALGIRLDRPGWGRDEEVKVVVPIAFRIKADLSALGSAHPTVVVRVQAVNGAVVRVDDKPVALDAHGEGAYAIDVSAQTTGWSDDVKLIDPSIPYSIVSPARDGHPATDQHGSLAVRAGIATLHLDAPGPTAVIAGGSFRVAGRTVKGGTVTINGQPVTVDADGAFARAYDAPSLGDVPVEVRADAPQLASRTARFTVKRVAHLATEASARERAPWVDYNGISAADSVGKATVVEGDVVETRAAANQVVALVDDTRGCDQGPCLVRVTYAGTEPVAHGDHVRVYGHVTGVLPVTAKSAAGARPVPAVLADFLVKGRAGAR